MTLPYSSRLNYIPNNQQNTASHFNQSNQQFQQQFLTKPFEYNFSTRQKDSTYSTKNSSTNSGQYKDKKLMENIEKNINIQSPPSFYFRPFCLQQDRKFTFQRDVQTLFTTTLDIYHQQLIINQQQSLDIDQVKSGQDINHIMNLKERELFISMKQAWKNLNFSLIHHSCHKDEEIDDYYQVLYEVILNECIQVSPDRDFQMALLLMCQYLTYKTWKGYHQKQSYQLKFNVSILTFQQILDVLCPSQHHNTFQTKLFKQLMNSNAFQFSFKDGLTYIRLDKSLNPIRDFLKFNQQQICGSVLKKIDEINSFTNLQTSPFLESTVNEQQIDSTNNQFIKIEQSNVSNTLINFINPDEMLKQQEELIMRDLKKYVIAIDGYDDQLDQLKNFVNVNRN
eukprot:403334793